MRHLPIPVFSCLVAALLTLGCGGPEEQGHPPMPVPTEVPAPIPGKPNIKRPLFVGTGTGPEWSVSVFQDTVRFKSSLPDIGDLIAPTPPPELIDKDGRRYKVSTQAGEMVIEISAQPCTDVRSGIQRPNTTRVTWGSASGSTPTVLNGCGRFLTEEAIKQERSADAAPR